MPRVATQRITSIWGNFEEGDPVSTGGLKPVPRKAIAAWDEAGLTSDKPLPPEPKELEEEEDEDMEGLEEEELENLTAPEPKTPKKK